MELVHLFDIIVIVRRLTMIKVFNNDDVSEYTVSNIYVLGKKGKPCIVIDMGEAKPEIIDYIKKHHSKVEALLLTHGHYDHIRGVNKFLEEFPNTPLYINKEDAEYLTNPAMNGSERHSKKITVNANPIFVKDKEEISFKAAKVTMIFTPYHTRGGVCYLVKEDNALFTGDSLFKGSIGRSDFVYSQPEKTIESLKKFLGLSNYTVCYPGHGPITRLKDEKRNNPFLMNLVK